MTRLGRAARWTAIIVVASILGLVVAAIVSPAPIPKPVVIHKHPVITFVVPTTTTTTVPPLPAPAPPQPVVVAAAPVPPPPPPPPPTTTTTTIPVKLSFLAEAQSQIGQVNPPYSAGGFWCWKFVNFVGDNSNVSGWVDSTGPNDFLSYTVDSAGPQPGDIALYDDPTQAAEGNDNIVHVGIVERVNGDGTFTAIEGNGDSATTVIETTRPISGPAADGLQVYEFVLP